MTRLFTISTILLASFCFVAVILINIGGVNVHDDSSLPVEANKAFNLLNWNYTITPEQTFDSYSYHLYLNRICPLEQSTGRPSTSSNYVVGYIRSTQCANNGVLGTLRAGFDLPAPNALVGLFSPFRFDTVNLNVPFAFYILSAATASGLIVYSLAASVMKQISMSLALSFLVLDLILFTFLTVASAVLTWQVVHLRDQIQDDTLHSGFYNSNNLGTDTIDFGLTMNWIKIGRAVMGLTWAAVFAMILDSAKWMFWMSKYKHNEHATKENDSLGSG